jgi:hypothetical protein
MLAQVLGEDEQARLTDLAVAPLSKEGVSLERSARYERLQLKWAGAKGEGEAALIVKALPDLTWSQAVNINTSIPAEVLLVEGDLSPAITQIIEDSFVASGRISTDRPAWLLSQDFSHLSTLDSQYDSQTNEVVLQKTATFHALHWGALRVLDDVYPWLPRFSDWIEAHCTLLRHLLREEEPPESLYYRWARQQSPNLSQKIRARWEKHEPVIASILEPIIDNPAPILELIQQSPQTIIHGTWRAKTLRLQDEQLIASQWDRIQVGPAAWDLYSYLNSVNRSTVEADIEQYFEHLRRIIPTLSDSECHTFRQAYDLCPLLHILLLTGEW